MTVPTAEQELILRVVRGDRHWRDLERIGIHVTLERTDHGQLKGNIENPKELVAIADVGDLARGLLCRRDNRDELRVWAFVLEAGSFVDFDVEGHPAGDLLLSALWDASFGNPIDPRALQIAQELTATQPTH